MRILERKKKKQTVLINTIENLYANMGKGIHKEALFCSTIMTQVMRKLISSHKQRQQSPAREIRGFNNISMQNSHSYPFSEGVTVMAMKAPLSL